jgi:hypothetical protein
MATWRDGTSTGRTGRNLENRWINTINVTDSTYGALGDDVDDSAAIEAAVAALTAGDTLYFPPGKYRYTTVSPANGAAIYLNAVSNVTIWFAPGAELLMDNLSGGEGTSHGIFIKGACENVRLVNVRVRWRTAPSTRSTGDGFHVLGYPKESGVTAGWTGSTGTCADVALINCEAIDCPQTGAIFMGCDRPRVSNFFVKDCLADGIHFNACRAPRMTGLTAENTGDDGLAFVTYYGATDAPTSDIYTGQNGPFSQLTLNEWCNGTAQASGITVREGSANGVRIAGMYQGSLSGVSVTGKSSGIIADSGEAGGSFDWTYLASRGCSVTGAAIDDCSTGLFVRVYNSDSADDEKFWRYSMVFSDFDITNCSIRCLRTQGESAGQNSLIAGLTFKGIRGNGTAISFAGIREAVITDIYNRSGTIQFHGQETALSGAMSTLPRHNVVIDNIFCDGHTIAFQDIRAVQVGRIRSYNSSTDGVTITRCHTISFDDINVSLANRGNTGTVRGFLIAPGQHIRVKYYECDHDANTTTTWSAFELGGGSATHVSDNVHIEKSVYRNTVNGTGSGVTTQGGGFAPTNWFLAHEHYNGGEVSPIWRAAHQGSPALPRHFVRAGTPLSNQIAPIGSTASRTDGGEDTTFYVKESGTDATGWTAIPDA